VDALLEALTRTGAEIIIASPYAAGGSVHNVPPVRRLLSVWANRYLSLATGNGLTTVTGMVRAYRGQWIRSLTLRSRGMAINCEIVAKALRHGARLAEVPARLDWGRPVLSDPTRRSSMRVATHTLEVLGAGVSLAVLRLRRSLRTKRSAG